MKQIKLSPIALGVATAGFFAFTSIDTGSIKGKVSPADGAVQAWAISATDTLKAPIANGAFLLARPGFIGIKKGFHNCRTHRLCVVSFPPAT
jgi:hypothetical protein